MISAFGGNEKEHISMPSFREKQLKQIGTMKSKSFYGLSPCFSDSLSGYIMVQLSCWPQISLSEKVKELECFTCTV